MGYLGKFAEGKTLREGSGAARVGEGRHVVNSEYGNYF